jgi:spore coat protein U-like protein
LKTVPGILLVFSIFITASIGYASDSNVVSVTATVLSKSQCKFNSNTATLNFANLDPANPVDRTVQTSITFRCGGSAPNATFSITDDDGSYEIASDKNRMRHTTTFTEYLPYSLTLSPTSGTVPKNTNQTVTVTGTVRGVDYQNAATGNYSDTVVITIEP